MMKPAQGQRPGTGRLRTRLLAILLGLVALGGMIIAGVFWFQGYSPSASRGALVDDAVSFRPETWAWKNEEHWAMDQSVRDIAEMLLFSAGEKPGDYAIEVRPESAPAHTYAIRISGPRLQDPLALKLSLKQHLWDPEDFQAFAGSLLTHLNLPSDTALPASSQELLQTLLTPVPSEIERAQVLASKQLTQHPRSASAQEDAAAVIAVLMLYNQSGLFQDDRFLLCRLTAHLALAQALRGKTASEGPSGKLAAIAVKIRIQHSLEAIQDIETARTATPPQLPAPWSNALYMLATMDWRPVADPVRASSAETLASFLGRVFDRGAEISCDWIEADARKWEAHRGFISRRALAGQYSVQLGHRTTRGLLRQELKDFQSVWQQIDPSHALAEDKVCDALNEIPRRTYDGSRRELVVLGTGIWARYFQANLLDDMMRTLGFNEHHYGSKEATDEFWASIEKRFSKLDQFPVLQKRFAQDRHALYGQAILRAARFAQTHPELIADASLVCINQKVNFGSLPKALPKYQDWLATPEPFGTLYNPVFRTYEMKEAAHRGKDEWVQLIQADPYCHWFVNNYLNSFKSGTLTKDDVNFAYAHIKEFSQTNYLAYLIETYPELDPEAIRLRREAAELDPKWFSALAYIFENNHREKEAAEAYLAFFHRCEDRVTVSNGMDWLVAYLCRTGQVGQARKIAQDCADTGSSAGLQTMAHFLELQGKPEEAEVCFQDITERYGERDQTNGLYFRWKDRRPAMKAKWEKAAAELFPEGLKPFNPATAPAKPTKGILFKGHTHTMERIGLRADAIVVGLDNYQVENQRQYVAVRSFSYGSHMSLNVFQNGGYVTIATNLHGRRFGVDMADYSR